MRLYAIDPGTERSAIVWIVDGSIGGAIWPNAQLLAELRTGFMGARGIPLVIEQIASYGMPVGAEVFDTCVWIGRFLEAWDRHGHGCTWSLLPRKAVKLALCGTTKAKDPNIRQALIDLYGGPACVKKGGPLAGIKSHLWAALALAVTHQRLHTDAQTQLVAMESGEK